MDDIKQRGSDRPQRFRFTPPDSSRRSTQPSSQSLNTMRAGLPSAKKQSVPVDDDFKDIYRPRKTAKKPKTKKKKTRRSKRKLLAFLFIITLCTIGGLGFKHYRKSPPVINNQPAVQSEQPKQQPLSGNFRIVATGDIITHDSVNQNAKKSDGSYDFAPMLEPLKPILEKAQTRICHNTVPAAGGQISGYPSFNAPTELISSLADNGCNVMSLASDHINDKGQAAIDATVQNIEQNKKIVIYDGANKSAEDQAKERYFNVGDGQVKFAYFSYTTRQNNPASTPFGVNVYTKETAANQIKKVRATADLVIVSVCWGNEDSGDIQPAQDSIAQELTDAGADVIFGHCPHFVQPVKKLKSSDGSRESIVYYSLGNTLNSQLPIEALIGGIAVIDLDLATKKITHYGFLPTYMHYEWTPEEKNSKNLNARKNLKLYPLDAATQALAASQNGTTVEAQTARINEIMSRFTQTKLYTSSELTN